MTTLFSSAVVAVQPREIHLGQLERRDLPRADQLGEMAHRPERDVLEIRGPLHGRRALSRNGCFVLLTVMPGTIGLKWNGGETSVGMCSLRISS